MKRANIYYKNVWAGVLTEEDDGYEFHYLMEYLALNVSKTSGLTILVKKISSSMKRNTKFLTFKS